MQVEGISNLSLHFHHPLLSCSLFETCYPSSHFPRLPPVLSSSRQQQRSFLRRHSLDPFSRLRDQSLHSAAQDLSICEREVVFWPKTRRKKVAARNHRASLIHSPRTHYPHAHIPAGNVVVVGVILHLIRLHLAFSLLLPNAPIPVGFRPQRRGDLLVDVTQGGLSQGSTFSTQSPAATFLTAVRTHRAAQPDLRADECP
jgi:hypothetical protein